VVTFVRVFLNGQIVDEKQALVPLSDRGLLYGDGLFETIRVRDGNPRWWNRHLARLSDGAAFLRIRLPFSGEELRAGVLELIKENAMPEAVLRVTLTRGVGPRGYSPKDATAPMLAMSLHPFAPPPESMRLATSSFRVVAGDGLAPFKTANKLCAVLARMDAERLGADEALLLNTDGAVAEAAANNVFWLEAGTICTPPLAAGALAGVARSCVLELCREQKWQAEERLAKPDVLLKAEGVFLTNSVAGVVPVSVFDGQPVAQSELVGQLRRLLEQRVE
jgi:aminodeoxychorismate lyase